MYTDTKENSLPPSLPPFSDGSVDLNSLLDQLNCSAQTAVSVKSEILQTVLRVFQLDSQKKAVFREVCGFHYLISTLASLIGSLALRRSTPWVGGEGMDRDGVAGKAFCVMNVYTYCST